MESPTPGKLGRYRILDEIGKGAMGVIYLAIDPLIGRQVALKTFRVAFSPTDEEMEEFRARFMREAQSAGILSHPNIVTIHDVVEEVDKGWLFIAMEYVEGTNLKELFQRGEVMELDRIVDIVSQVADGLDYAHAKGVVHRDIKPANIIVSEDEAVKITDFGIARLNTSNLTQEGQLLGTPNYMAPEQVQGEAVDHRADIFSLGVMLYEMITGHKPFQGDSLTTVSHRIVYDTFTAPEEYVADLSPALKRVLERALDKDPDRRYQSAGELAADLRQAQTEVSTGDGGLPADQAVPAPVTVSAGPWVRARDICGAVLQRAGTVLQRQQVPPWRLAGLALSCAVLGALFGWIAVRAVTPAEGDSGGLAREHLLRAHYLKLVRAGHAYLQQNEPVAAARVLARAERMVPGGERLQELRQEAELRVREHREQGARDRELNQELERARAALAARRYREAIAAAQGALELEPAHPEAEEVLADARRAAASSQQRLQAGGVSDGRAAGEAATRVSQEPGTPVRGFLDVDFFSEAPEGVLTIYADKTQILRESFRYVERSGILRRAKGTSGGFARRLEVEAGPAVVRVYVALKNQPAQVSRLQADIPGNGSSRLEIRVSKEGEAKASLQ